MFSAGMVIGSALLMAQVAAGGMRGEVRPFVILVVQGQDAVPSAVWRKARAVATRILDHAGLHPVWQDDPDGAPGNNSSSPFHSATNPWPGLCVRLSRTRPSTLHSDAAGFAVLAPGAGYASVFLPGVERTAAELEVEPGTVLGATMAHEIGHLLLGAAHSFGVMSGRFGSKQMRAAERGELRFRDEDARRMRQLLTALIK